MILIFLGRLYCLNIFCSFCETGGFKIYFEIGISIFCFDYVRNELVPAHSIVTLNVLIETDENLKRCLFPILPVNFPRCCIFYHTSFRIFNKSNWRLIFCKRTLVKCALFNFLSPNQETISIDVLSIRISIRISNQNMLRDQQVKGYRESALSCFENYALCCIIYTLIKIRNACLGKSNIVCHS